MGTNPITICRTHLNRLLGVVLVSGTLGTIVSPGPVSGTEPQQAYAPSGAEPAPTTLRGPACAVDGDTLMFGATGGPGRCRGGTEVHLRGIDAPEFAQKCSAEWYFTFACGRSAKSQLAKRLRNQVVTCTARPAGRKKGLAGECFTDGENLNAAMVSSGWALRTPGASGAYAVPERKAREARRGLWGTQFVPPWMWRRKAS